MNKTIMVVVGVALLGGFLFWAGRTQQPAMVFVEGTNVACLPNGHQNIATHIHPVLSIFVDGEQEHIPANIGITGTCMSELHTHDASGTLHVETVTRVRLQELSFADFFDMWGRSVEREGYDLVIMVNGERVESVANVPLEDRVQIQLIYTSVS